MNPLSVTFKVHLVQGATHGVDHLLSSTKTANILAAVAVAYKTAAACTPRPLKGCDGSGHILKTINTGAFQDGSAGIQT